MNKDERKKYIITGAVAIVLLTIIGAVVYGFIDFGTEEFLEVGNLYDSNGSSVSKGFLSKMAVVQGVEGVKYIDLKVNIENTDTVDLNFKMTELTPEEISDAINTQSVSIESGSKGEITTGLIDIEKYVGTVQEFCITVKSEEIPALRQESFKSECIQVDVQPNPEGSYDITLDSGTSSNDDDGMNPGCEESWTCTEWSDCIDGVETRICTDSNDCGTSINKPSESQTCEVSSFETNAVDGNYGSSGTWIVVNSITYTTTGTYSTLLCSDRGMNPVDTTPEGNAICWRDGYSETEKLYVEYPAEQRTYIYNS